ncbi:ArsR/SmtB family transcription factor [Alicyclobacillus sp. ALC3]|uniref:ArsR/SmtB family transcription factor n=1 Tax=Alicyclobacillus sp. ALC3 TaxID=2796143 RepID=UPI002378C0D1|nr:helix-turn-helix domain-containing protein [Alicyclobacillus sp. ALC3]WDL98681.1 helix-turn-helix transcriptional regulator [Alicyclobacillus sp. ALC3]
MAELGKISDLELMKLLLDPKRSQILEYAAGQALTVAELAERIGEKPSRLYYHVHKLEEAGLLEVVETRQIGNLVERFYQSKGHNMWLTPDLDMLNKNAAWFLQRVQTIWNPGLGMLSRKLAGESTHVKLSMSLEQQTVEEWRRQWQALDASFPASDQQQTHTHTAASETDSQAQQETAVNDGGQKRTFAFVVMSYEIDEARALGLFPDDDE